MKLPSFLRLAWLLERKTRIAPAPRSRKSGNPKLKLDQLEDRATPGSMLDLLLDDFAHWSFTTSNISALPLEGILTPFEESIPNTSDEPALAVELPHTVSSPVYSAPSYENPTEATIGSMPYVDDISIAMPLMSVDVSDPPTTIAPEPFGEPTSANMGENTSASFPLIVAADFSTPASASASEEPPPVPNSQAASVAGFAAPRQLNRTDLQARSFMTRSGVGLQIDEALEFPSATSVTLSGGDTTIVTGVDPNGIEFTQSTTFDYSHTIESSISETGAWWFTETYRYNYDTVTTPVGGEGATIHQWGTSGYTLVGMGSALASQYILSADLADHETGSIPSGGVISGTWTDNREETRTLTVNADLISGRIVGSDSGSGRSLRNESESWPNTTTYSNDRIGTALGTSLVSSSERVESNSSSSYDSARESDSRYQGSRITVETLDEHEEFEESGTYTVANLNPVVNGVAHAAARRDAFSRTITTDQLVGDDDWQLIGEEIEARGSGWEESSFTESTTYSHVLTNGPYQNIHLNGTRSNTELERSSFEYQGNAVLDLATDDYLTTGTIQSIVDTTSSSQYYAEGAYSRGGSSRQGEFGPEGLKATGNFVISTAQGKVYESGRTLSETNSVRDQALNAEGDWDTLGGVRTGNDYGEDRLGHVLNSTFAHQIGLGAGVGGTRTDAVEDGTSYAVSMIMSFDPSSEAWSKTESLTSSAFGTTHTDYAGSGRYDRAWWGARGTFGPEGLEATGDPWYRRAGNATTTGEADTSYRYELDSVIAADGTWQAVAGRAQASTSSDDRTGLTGTLQYVYPVGSNGSVAGTKNETQDDGVSHVAESTMVLNVATGVWISSGGYRDTISSGSAESSYAGSGRYDRSWWGTRGTFGPDRMEATGDPWYRRAGTATDHGSASSDYEYRVRHTLATDGTWSLESGTGQSHQASEDRSGLTGTLQYSYPVGSNGSVGGTKNETQTDGVVTSGNTSAALDVATGAWSTTGELHTTATGSAHSDYAGSGRYDRAWWGVRATFGPEGLEATGDPWYRRAGTAFDEGHADSSYRYDSVRSLDAGGEWVGVSGTGQLTSSGVDVRGLIGTLQYQYPVGANGTVRGAKNESQRDATSHRTTLVSNLIPGSDAWTTTGGLETGASGTASSTYEGSGGYDRAWWGARGTFGASGMEVTGDPWYRRIGTATDEGFAETSYDYHVFHELVDNATWRITGGTGTVDSVEEDTSGLTGVLQYRYPVAFNGSVGGTENQSQSDTLRQTVHTVATLDPVTGVWAMTGMRAAHSTGSSDSTHSGSGGYDRAWWGARGTFGPTDLEATGDPWYRRIGTATDGGYESTDYTYDLVESLTPTGAWSIVSGNASSTASAESHQGFTGILQYRYPVGSNGSVFGTENQTLDDATGYTLETTAVWDLETGIWSTTGDLETRSFGSSESSYQGSGAYDRAWWGARDTFGPSGLEATGDPWYRRIGTATDHGHSVTNYDYRVQSVIDSQGDWTAVSGTGFTLANGEDRKGLTGTLQYVYPIGANGTLRGTQAESQDEGTSYNLEINGTLDAATGSWVRTGGLDAVTTGSLSLDYAASGTYDRAWWGARGTFGATGIEATGDPWYRRIGSATESGFSDASYRIELHSELNPAGQFIGVTGTGTNAVTSEHREGLSGTIDYVYPVSGGTMRGRRTESQEDGVWYTLDTTSTLGTDGEWTSTGTLQEVLGGHADSTFAGSGTYQRNDFGRNLTGTVHDGGTTHSSYEQTALSVLTPEGSWRAVDGLRTEGGLSVVSSDYSGSTSFTANAGDYIAGIESGSTTASASESGEETTTSTYETRHVIGANGQWVVLSGTSTTRGEGTGENSMSMAGGYSRGSTSGRWSVQQDGDFEFLALSNGTLGQDGRWSTSGTTHTTYDGTGAVNFSGSSSSSSSSGNGTSHSSSSSSSSESFSYGWGVNFESDSSLAPNGSVSTVTSFTMTGGGGGSGSGQSSSSSESSGPNGNSSSQSTGSNTWSISMTDSQQWVEEANTIVDASGRLVRSGSASGSESHGGSMNYQYSGSGSSHSFWHSGSATDTRTGNSSSGGSGGDSFSASSTWSRSYEGDQQTSSSSSRSGNSSGNWNSNWGNSWTHNWTDGNGNAGSESGGDNGSDGNSYSNDNPNGGFASDYYSRGHGVAVYGVASVPWWTTGPNPQLAAADRRGVDRLIDPPQVPGDPDRPPNAGPPTRPVKPPQPVSTWDEFKGRLNDGWNQIRDGSEKLAARSAIWIDDHLTHVEREIQQRHAAGDSWTWATIQSSVNNSPIGFIVRHSIQGTQADVRGYQAAGASGPKAAFLAIANNLPIVSMPNRIAEVVTGRSFSGKDLGRPMNTGERLLSAGIAGLDIWFASSMLKAPAATLAEQRLAQIVAQDKAAIQLAQARRAVTAEHALAVPSAGSRGRIPLVVLDGPKCFAAGTPLLTVDGPRAIEELRAGDLLLSRSEADPKGELDYKAIEEIFIRVALLYHVQVGGRVIRTTAEHPFYVDTKGWVIAADLRTGDRLLGHDGKFTAVEKVNRGDEVETVYNMRVADFHTYFVGCDEWGFNVWAHNDCYGDFLKALRAGDQHPAVLNGKLKQLFDDLQNLNLTKDEFITALRTELKFPRAAVRNAWDVAAPTRNVQSFNGNTAQLTNWAERGYELTSPAGVRLTPEDFGLKTLAQSDKELLELWKKTVAETAAGDNNYSRLINKLAKDPSATITKDELTEAWRRVSNNFLPAAREKGYNIAEIHHWNFEKNFFVDRLTDPTHLVPLNSEALHAWIHKLTTSIPTFLGNKAGPTAPLHQIPRP